MIIDRPYHMTQRKRIIELELSLKFFIFISRKKVRFKNKLNF